MTPAIRAIAVDYDGTIAEHDRADANVLEVLAIIRSSGVKIVLATGRIYEDLVGIFPDVRSRFDVIVAENGAHLIFSDGRERLLANAVAPVLIKELEGFGIVFRAGRILLDTSAIYTREIADAIGRLGLDEQVLRNRDALMVLPARVSKGSGVDEAFAELGISHHSAIGIGDAENDHALLSACEIGVAVGNAVEALKMRADIVIEKTGAAGLADWLRRAHAEEISLASKRRVALGVDADGSPALIPSSMCNVLIAGRSGSGKSYLAGLFAERLVRAGYSICMIDPEGDYTRLGELRGVLTLGGSHPPPSSDELAPLVRHRLGSLVVDLSLLPEQVRTEYTRETLKRMSACRAATGLPHWIFVDEAHASLADDEPFRDLFRQKGVCLVTYHPQDLGELSQSEMDFGLFLRGSDDFACTLFPAYADAGKDVATKIDALPPRTALIVDRDRPTSSPQTFIIDRRVSAHVRHRHKYAQGSLSSDHCFAFRNERGALTGRMACNVAELEQEIATVPLGSIAHHVRCGDFSRWAGESLQDHALGKSLRDVETGSSSDTEKTRHALLLAIHGRYVDDALAS